MMEFNISDLLDDFQDSAVELHPRSTASASRIRELTMKKIRYENRAHKRGAGLLRKATLVAAAVMLLLTSVVAATGFNFSDWINGTGGPGYDKDVHFGSDSRVWGGEDQRRICLSAENEDAAGLTVVCEDIGWNEALSLSVGTECWLEKWETGKYVRLAGAEKTVRFAEEIQTIPFKETVSWDINWEDAYGRVSGGYYRLGMTFFWTDASGKTEENICYAKFRIYTEEMAPYLEQCAVAFDGLLQQESCHLLYTIYPGILGDQGLFYTYYTNEIWKSGGAYLKDAKYILESETGSVPVQRGGNMLRGGEGYTLNWEGDTVQSPVSCWNWAEYIDEGNFTLWSFLLRWDDARVGDVMVDGNRITLLGTNGTADYPYEEIILIFDHQGNLVRLENWFLPEKECEESEKALYGTLEIFGTSADEIAQIIDSQDVITPNSFSWAEDQTAYPGAKREGFENVMPQAVSTAEDAVRIAEADCTWTGMERGNYDNYYNIVTVYHDAQAGMWKVVFTFSQDDCFQSVYLDEQGITRMSVEGNAEE